MRILIIIYILTWSLVLSILSIFLVNLKYNKIKDFDFQKIMKN